MKFQIGDTVKVVANKKRMQEIGIFGPSSAVKGDEGEIKSTDELSPLHNNVYFPRIGDNYYFDDQDLELVKRKCKAKATSQPKTLSQIRKFDTGATRDTLEGKLSYVKALSPIVLQRYV